MENEIEPAPRFQTIVLTDDDPDGDPPVEPSSTLLETMHMIKLIDDAEEAIDLTLGKSDAPDSRPAAAHLGKYPKVKYVIDEDTQLSDEELLRAAASKAEKVKEETEEDDPDPDPPAWALDVIKKLDEEEEDDDLEDQALAA